MFQLFGESLFTCSFIHSRFIELLLEIPVPGGAALLCQVVTGPSAPCIVDRQEQFQKVGLRDGSSSHKPCSYSLPEQGEMQAWSQDSKVRSHSWHFAFSPRRMGQGQKAFCLLPNEEEGQGQKESHCPHGYNKAGGTLQGLRL